MARHNKFLALLAGSALAISGSLYAQNTYPSKNPAPATSTKSQTGKSAPAPAAKKSADHVARGVVKSLSDDQLVLERNGKNKKEMTLTMDSSTKKTGDIKAGSHVIVHYRNENNRDVATSVRPMAQKQARK
jgi:hypothetical protein